MYDLSLPGENFSHVTLGPGVDVGPGHLLKLMVEDFDLSLLGNMNENLGYILTDADSKLRNGSER